MNRASGAVLTAGAEPWAIQHREGWCSAPEGRKPKGANVLKTECGTWVVYPFKIEQRMPTCFRCVEGLALRRRRESSESGKPS